VAGPAASAGPVVPVAPPGGKAGVLPAGMRPGKAEGHLAAVVCLGFSPDGREIVSGSEDRTLLVWDVESGRIGRVAPVNCPGAPTDPDVRDYRIRLFSARARYAGRARLESCGPGSGYCSSSRSISFQAT